VERQEAHVDSSFNRKMTRAAMAVLAATLVWSAAEKKVYGQAAPQKKVKDQGEYDLYNNAVKETDPAKKLQYVNQWAEKYPETDFKEERLQLYDQLNQPAKVVELGQKLLASDPKSLVALTLVAGNVQKLPSPTAEQIGSAQKAAQTLLDSLDSLKPAGTADSAWQQVRPKLESLAKGTQMWIVDKPGQDAVQRKDYVAAEQAFTKALQQYPDNAQFAYQLGSALVSQRNADKFPQAIYEIARAVATDPAKGGLAGDTRTQVDAYLNRIYTQYHGADDEGLKQLKQLALTSPFPPATFKLKTANEIAAEKEQEFREKNPQLALWMGIKKQLTDANGEQYFEMAMKGADVPKLKGTLVEAKPACRPKELTVALSDATHAEIALKLDMALAGKPKTGVVFQFKGVPSTFTKDPFMVTMDAERGNLEGLETEACAAAPARRGGARRAAKKK
jgi:tetratricopeptide (TPR) repeat protein